MSTVVRRTGGFSFKAGEDTVRLIVSGKDAGGLYSLLEWTVAAGKPGARDNARDYGPQRHDECEETFLIQTGSLEFLIGEDVVTLNQGDFVRVAPGVRHGYQNISGEPVEMLVTFTPGGFEELFVKYRSDQADADDEGFVLEATRDYASEFGLY